MWGAPAAAQHPPASGKGSGVPPAARAARTPPTPDARTLSLGCQARARAWGCAEWGLVRLEGRVEADGAP